MTNPTPQPVPSDLSFTIGGLTKMAEMNLSATARIERKIDDVTSVVAGHDTRLTKIETEIETLKTVRKDALTIRQAVWGAVGTLFAVIVAGFVIYEKLSGVL